MNIIEVTNEMGEYLVELRCNQREYAIIQNLVNYLDTLHDYHNLKEKLTDDLGLE